MLHGDFMRAGTRSNKETNRVSANYNTNTLTNYEPKDYPAFNGFLSLIPLLVFGAVCTYMVVNSFHPVNSYRGASTVFAASGWVWGIGGGLSFLILLSGLTILQPNEQAVVTFFGEYRGVIAREGFYWVNPLARIEKYGARVENFETGKLKVNDANGSPIEIAAVISWRPSNIAQASLSLDDYHEFVIQQSEAALREIAGNHPYESKADEEQKISLRNGREAVANELVSALTKHMAKYGLEVNDASISHLSYAPEIAAAMLQRQQAEAIIDARKALIEGATSMVDGVVAHYTDEKSKVNLTDEEKGRLVTNLMVSLTADKSVTPTIPLS
jgi:hypothetical protein